MKQIYEEPNMETILVDGTVIVYISGKGTESDTLSDDYYNMFV